MAHVEKSIVFSGPRWELLERYRNTFEHQPTMSQLLDDLLAKSPELVRLNQTAKIDFGSDADQPKWNTLCKASDEPKPSTEKTSSESPKRRSSKTTRDTND